MPNVYASPDDVAARWRPLSSQEEATASALLVDASFRVRRRFPTVDARIAAGTLDALEVVGVVAGMVKRAMLAGGEDGVAQLTEAAGPYSSSRRYVNPLGNLFFTADDIDALGDPLTSPSRRAFAVDLTPPVV